MTDNMLHAKAVQQFLETNDCKALSDRYVSRPEVQTFVIEDLEDRGRFILLHINPLAQHTLMVIEEQGKTASTSYFNHGDPMSFGELVGHEVNSLMDMFLGPHARDKERQQQLVKRIADDLLDEAANLPGICGLFEALGANATPPVNATQLALCLLQGIDSDMKEIAKEAGRSPCNLTVANTAVRALRDDSIAYIKLYAVKNDETDAEPNVLVIFNRDKRTVAIAVEHADNCVIHFVDGTKHKDGANSKRLWDPLFELLAGTPELAPITSSVRDYIKCQQQLGVLDKGHNE